MEFEDFKDKVVNYLEAEGIDSESVSDDVLWRLWNKGVKPSAVATAIRASTDQ